jgi:hypothetical protein
VNSPTKTWLGHKGNSWTISVVSAAAGSCCVTGNPDQGTVCER